MFRGLLPACMCMVLLVATHAQAQQTDAGNSSLSGQGALGLQEPANLDTRDAVHRAEEGSALKFRSETVLVQVDAVVTDKSGGHIHQLTKDDFRIFENGKPQKITHFEEITASNGPLPPAADRPATFSNLAHAGGQPRAITVIALDMVNTPFLDQAYGRQQLIKYLADKLDSGQALALVAIGRKGVKVLSGLSSDPASLVNALKKVSGELPPMHPFGTDGQIVAATESRPSELGGGIGAGEPPEVVLRRFIVSADAVEGQYQQVRAIEATMRGFLAIAWSLSGIPGRKALIWATGGFPFYLDSESTVPGGNLAPLYERAMEALRDAEISVYPVDLRGLMATSTSGDDAMFPGDGFSVNVGRSMLDSSHVDTLKNFAEMTGGRAYYSNSDLVAGFKRAVDDSSSYYLLGYYLDSHNTKSGWRKLQVQVSRKDTEVRARTGFFVTHATVDPEVTHNADIGFALSSPFDSTGLAVTMQWQGTRSDGEKRKVGFALRVPALGVIDEADQNRFDVDFIAQATAKGLPAGKAGRTAKGTLTADALAKIKTDGILYKDALELSPGDYQVRFVVRDNLSGRIGTVSAPLTVN